MPFEFVQEIEIKTGGISAEHGKATGGIFNVVTKSGSNEFHGDAFLFFTPQSFVREVKSSAIPFTGSAQNGFSEVDAGFDIGGPIETGGSNYTARLNSTFTPTFTAEFSFGLHLQRANTLPEASVADTPLVLDNFAIRNGTAIVNPVNSTATINVGAAPLRVAFVDGRGGTLERNFVRGGFGLVSEQDRDRIEGQARFQNNWGKHTFKYGIELAQNRYNILTRPTGPARNFADPNGEEVGADHPASEYPLGYRVTNNFGVCTVQGTNVACPAAALTNRVNALITAGQAPAGILSASTNAALTSAQLSTNPFLVLSSVRVRDFVLNTGGEPTTTNTQSFYIQDDFKVTRNLMLNLGARWDYQQSYGTSSTTSIWALTTRSSSAKTSSSACRSIGST